MTPEVPKNRPLKWTSSMVPCARDGDRINAKKIEAVGGLIVLRLQRGDDWPGNQVLALTLTAAKQLLEELRKALEEQP